MLHAGLGSYSSDKEFDFDLVGNRIIMHINSFNIILETGSNISMMDSVTARKLKLPFLSPSLIPTPGGDLNATLTKFDFWGQFSSVHCVILPLEDLSESLDCNIHGILGVENNIILENVIEINFSQKKVSFCKEVDINTNDFHIYPLVANNKNMETSLGKAFPVGPSMDLPIIFQTNDTVMTNLVIDTGCQFMVAFLSRDSTLINLYANENNEYKALDGTNKMIKYGKVCVKMNKHTNTVNAPFFCKPNFTIPIRNNFYGLLGVPFLKEYTRVIVDWPNRKIFFRKK